MAPPSTAVPKGRSRLFLLVVLGSLSAFGPMATDLYLPGFSQIATSLGVDIGSVQLTLSACLVGIAVGQILYGPLSDRFGRRGPLLAGLAVYTLASIGCAIAPNLEVLVVLRFVQALGGSAGMVVPRAMVRDMYSGTELARTLSAITMVFAIGPVLAPLLGGLILMIAPWPWLFIALAIFGVLCIFGVFMLPETLPRERRTTNGLAGTLDNFRIVGSDRGFWLPTAILGLNMILLFSYISSGPAVFVDSFGLSSTMFGIVFGINSAFIVVGARLNMHLLGRFRPHTLMRAFLMISVGASAVLLIFAIVGVPVVVFIVPVIIATACVQAVGANASAELLHPFGERAGAAASLSGVIQMSLGALTAAVLGIGLLRPPLQMSLGMVIAGTAALLLALRPPPALEEAPHA